MRPTDTFWLFRADPIADAPSAADRQLVEALEPRVAAFDELVRVGELGAPRESARRKLILAELREAGVLDEPRLDRKIEVLGELGLAHLASLATAARLLAAYYAGPERARFVRHPAPASIHTAALSLDWARSVTAGPEGLELFVWWTICEDAFLGAADTGAERGAIVVVQGPIAAELAWRWEDGARRTLYAARPRERRTRS
jgi:hypothetical protein